MRFHQVMLRFPAVERLFKARELEGFDQVIHHAVVDRGLDRGGIGGGSNHDRIDAAGARTQGGQQIQPVILLHIDIQ